MFSRLFRSSQRKSAPTSGVTEIGPECVTIITPPHTVFLAHLVAHCVSGWGFQPSINVGEYYGDFADLLFVVLCPQVFKRLPETFIAFQMEQTGTPWFDQGYLDLLKSPSIRVLDYSTRNRPFLLERGVPEDHLRTAQLAVVPGYREFLRQQSFLSTQGPANIDFDVLFYGGINERRFRMLSTIDRRFCLKVAVGVFGPPLYDLIARSRIVVNIHTQDESPLESTRVFEALSMQKPVVSETAPDVGDYEGLGDAVVFARCGDCDLLAQAIETTLRATPVIADALPTAGYERFSAALQWAAQDLAWL